jgi:adenylate cyclase
MPILTALGDAVNTAARLENATKELQVPVVVSRDTLEAAQLSAEPTLRDILLRGRSTQLSAAALDKNSLRQLLGATAHL